MRPIDADGFLERNAEFANREFIHPKYQTTLRELIESAPTLSPDEVRGVVRCKECKWCHAGYCEKYDDLIPFGCANKPWEDWFCADGEMKGAEDGTTDNS